MSSQFKPVQASLINHSTSYVASWLGIIKKECSRQQLTRKNLYTIWTSLKFTSISATDSDMSTTDDVQKRERIEKYKEQRRSKLRETYKPENYRSSSQSSLESQSTEESSIPSSRKRKVCIFRAFRSLELSVTQWSWAVVQREKKFMAYDLHPVLIPHLVSQNS